ncbi:MAG: hypothetical protein NDI61_00355 [Bdellovibrionaceae bacterium]|nr:hypothetical protein [Pseudobdellovibrionaceae bacterium]
MRKLNATVAAAAGFLMAVSSLMADVSVALPSSTVTAKKPSVTASSTSSAATSVASMTSLPAKSSAWSASASGEYYVKHRRDHEAHSDVTLSVNYKWSDASSFSLRQTGTKYMVVPYGEPEFVIDDTTLIYTRLLLKDWNGFSVRARPSLSLPTSRESGRQGIVSRPTLALPISREFLGKKLTASYTPLYRYQINRFQTRIGGAPLPQHALAHTLGLSYAFTESISASVSAQGQYVWSEQSPYAQVPPRPRGQYAYDANLSYKITGYLDVGIGYLQSDKFIKEGRYDVNLYDPSTSRYYISLATAL